MNPLVHFPVRLQQPRPDRDETRSLELSVSPMQVAVVIFAAFSDISWEWGTWDLTLIEDASVASSYLT